MDSFNRDVLYTFLNLGDDVLLNFVSSPARIAVFTCTDKVEELLQKVLIMYYTSMIPYVGTVSIYKPNRILLFPRSTTS